MTTLLASPRSGSRASRHTRLDALDGLRAVAVSLVLAYHVGVPGMDGGFLGVDVFFVLSGFLITTLLIREVTGKGKIDLGRFWMRRVLRLLPASLLVIVVVLGWSIFFSPSYRRADLGADAFWSLLYVGNWRFISSSGYFNNDGSVSPLQHVWSLAVEEQFYVVWPLLIAGLVLPLVKRATLLSGAGSDSASRTEMTNLRRATARKWVLVLAVALTLMSAIWFAIVYDPLGPDRAYMGTDTRAYEPLAGAAAAALMQYRTVQLFVTRNAQPLMIAGLVGVVVGVFTLGGPTAPAPAYFLGGGLAFAVVTAVLVAATSVADRRQGLTLLFGSTPMGYLGRISYGVYLWHWPLTLWIIGDAPFSPVRALITVALTIAAAAASFQFLETPVRSRGLARSRPKRLLPASLGIVGAMTLIASVLGGTPWNVALPAFAGPKNDGRAIVVVGDSVIQRLLPALDKEASARGLTVTSGARGGCPALGIRAVDDAGAPLAQGNCVAQVVNRQNEAIDAVHPGVVIWWSRYEVADRLGPAGTVLRAGTDAFWEAQLADLRTAVDRVTATGASLVIVEMDRPGIGIDTRCTPEDCPEFLHRLRNRDDLRQDWNKHLHAYAATDPRVQVITMDTLFCRDDASPCDDHLPSRADTSVPFAEAAGNDLARPDGSHFSEAGAATVSSALLDRVLALTKNSNQT
ncbi:MAG: acyltransferase family protein [Dermatophilus congolensis]|nr:acyltransferase family protein [Dermatophilus congolensis]